MAVHYLNHVDDVVFPLCFFQFYPTGQLPLVPLEFNTHLYKGYLIEFCDRYRLSPGVKEP